MVLESIIRPSKMEKTPGEMLLVGFFYSSLGLFLASVVFGDYKSISAVFITTIPLIVIISNTIKYEESKDHMLFIAEIKKELDVHNERFLIKEHGKALSLFMFLFIGMLISYSLWFVILPEEQVEGLFEFQLEIIKSVNPGAVGNFSSPEGAFLTILMNNFRVLFLCVVFSFLYGAGAIFILTLNASVIGVVIGSTIRKALLIYSRLQGGSLTEYFSAFPVSFVYMVHGIPEIAAYFFGALGGGIISVATVNHSIRSREFWRVVVDSLDMIMLSALLLGVAALIEVFISPMLV